MIASTGALTYFQALAAQMATWIEGNERWPPAPPPAALPPKFEPLQRIVNEAIRSNQKFADLGVVVLNFGHPGRVHTPPTCAVWNDTKWVSIGSAAKLAILCAAFQLKADLQYVLANVAPSIAPRAPTLADLQAPLADYWRSIAALKNVRIPDLAVLFDAPAQDLNGAWGVDFAGSFLAGYVPNWTADAARRAEIDKMCTAHEHEYKHGRLRKAADKARAAADKSGNANDARLAVAAEQAELAGLQTWYARLLALPFAERLWMTTRWSDNLAATQCAVDLALTVPDANGKTAPVTLRYLQAVLKESGLGAEGKGFWLKKAYQAPPKPPRPPGLALWPDGGGAQMGDARSLARLLWGMAEGTLISADDSDAMLRLLQRPEPHLPGEDYHDLDDNKQNDVNWARSFIADGIDAAVKGRVVYCASKIGILGSQFGDWVLVKCDIGGAVYRFGIVVLNGFEQPKPAGWTESNPPDTVSMFARALFERLILPANQRALGNVP